MGIKMAKEIIFKGEMTGTVIGDQKFYGATEIYSIFAFKLDKEILGVPDEFIVHIKGNIPYVRKGDKIKIDGNLIKIESKDWKLPIYLFKAKKLYNLTLKFSLIKEI